LLLDEVTSALDAQTEAAINATLRAIGRERTIIQITHRLSAAAQADYIYVLDGGCLVEQGTHATLMDGRSLYWRLWQHQAG
jgi:ABC-type multidrug transport system fused ATPase/permease subunit